MPNAGIRHPGPSRRAPTPETAPRPMRPNFQKFQDTSLDGSMTCSANRTPNPPTAGAAQGCGKPSSRVRARFRSRPSSRRDFSRCPSCSHASPRPESRRRIRAETGSARSRSCGLEEFDRCSATALMFRRKQALGSRRSPERSSLARSTMSENSIEALRNDQVEKFRELPVTLRCLIVGSAV